jgi:hypothetical protein
MARECGPPRWVLFLFTQTKRRHRPARKGPGDPIWQQEEKGNFVARMVRSDSVRMGDDDFD